MWYGGKGKGSMQIMVGLKPLDQMKAIPFAIHSWPWNLRAASLRLSGRIHERGRRTRNISKSQPPIDLEPEGNAAEHAQAPAQTRDDDSDMSDGTLLKVCEHIEQQVALKKQRAADADAKWDGELWAIFDELEQKMVEASKAGSPKAQVDRAAPVMVP